jgi:hypothetical protein
MRAFRPQTVSWRDGWWTRGVRFVQLYAGSNAADSWDAHADLEGNHTKRAHAADKPISGLLKDLKSRGLLDFHACCVA